MDKPIPSSLAASSQRRAAAWADAVAVCRGSGGADASWGEDGDNSWAAAPSAANPSWAVPAASAVLPAVEEFQQLKLSDCYLEFVSQYLYLCTLAYFLFGGAMAVAPGLPSTRATHSRNAGASSGAAAIGLCVFVRNL